MAAQAKKLTLSKDKKISGVCGGIAEYLDFDPTIVRLGMAFFILVTGIFPGLIFYVVAALVMPDAEGAK